MSDDDADKYATWAFKAAIYLLFGVLIVAFLLFQRYPKIMLPIIGIFIAGGVAYSFYYNNSPYSYRPTYPTNAPTKAMATPAVSGASLRSEQTQTSSVAVKGPPVGPKQLYLGALVQVTALELNIRPNPGTDGTPIGRVKQGARLEIVSGPVWLPTTSDDGQPLERDWWQVVGWDAGGTLGWCSSRYLEVAP
jgi:hypothetical protein